MGTDLFLTEVRLSGHSNVWGLRGESRGCVGVRTLVRSAMLGLVFVLSGVRSSAAQATHLVKFHADTVAGEYRFEPAVIVAHPHDVLVFRLVNGAPHNITFESADLSPQVHDA